MPHAERAIPSTLTRTKVIVGVCFLILIGIIAVQALERAAYSIRLAFAEEQCEIFVSMVEQAKTAMNGEPPDPRAAAQCLEYTHSYYRSGTKQNAGSSLDKIVENCRRASEMQIIHLLKSKTGLDLGNDPTVWIQHFNKSPEL